MSGINFGHYKLVTINDKLSDIMAVITKILYATGCRLKIWLSILNFILMKEANILKTSKLDCIKIMVANLKTNHKQVGQNS